MIRRPILAALSVLAFAGCANAPLEAPSRGDFSADLIERAEPGPPPGPKGACWQADIRPAVIETETEQVLIQPQGTAADGSVIPAVYGVETRQRIVQDRATVWFRAPCGADLTPDFIATLQRALKARGFYMLPLTGVLDAPTRDAIRRFQSARGLDSDHLSLAAARDLGIIAVDRQGL